MPHRTEQKRKEIIMENLIQKTRDSLIAQHGESTIQIVDGYKYKRINTFLDSFDVFVARFGKLIEKTRFDYMPYAQELAIMYKYFEQAEEHSINEIARSLISLINRINDQNMDNYQKKLENFFESIRRIKDNPKFNLEQIKVCFGTDLGLNVQMGSYMRKPKAQKNVWIKR